MLYLLKRHPFTVAAEFRHCVVLTYALPEHVLAPLLPPGLTLDTYGEFGFLAIAIVQVEAMRPALLPRWVGGRFMLAGYRVFARYRSASGRTLRGLRILRSITDRRAMVMFGNLLTHYCYRRGETAIRGCDRCLTVHVATPGSDSDFDAVVDLKAEAELPPGSPFSSWAQARRFAGPLPYTFDYEPQTHSIVLIKGVRREWNPRPVSVRVVRNTFFERPPFTKVRPVLASAFYVSGIPYRWERGVREKLAGEPA